MALQGFMRAGERVKFMKEVHRFLVTENLKYYREMSKLFPEEDVWKRAIKDCEELLKGE